MTKTEEDLIEKLIAMGDNIEDSYTFKIGDEEYEYVGNYEKSDKIPIKVLAKKDYYDKLYDDEISKGAFVVKSTFTLLVATWDTTWDPKNKPTKEGRQPDN